MSFVAGSYGTTFCVPCSLDQSQQTAGDTQAAKEASMPASNSRLQAPAEVIHLAKTTRPRRKVHSLSGQRQDNQDDKLHI